MACFRLTCVSLVFFVVFVDSRAGSPGVSPNDENALLESDPEQWALNTFHLSDDSPPDQIYQSVVAFAPKRPMLCPPPVVSSKLTGLTDLELIERFEQLEWETSPKLKLDLLQLLDSRGESHYQLHDFDLVEHYHQAGRVGCANWRAFVAEPADSFCGNYYQSFTEQKALWQYWTLLAAGDIPAAVGLLVSFRRVFQVDFRTGHHSEDYQEELSGFGLDPAELVIGEYQIHQAEWAGEEEQLILFLKYLRAVGTAETVPIIESLLSHSEKRVRSSAVEALGLIAFNPPDGQGLFFGSWSNFYGGYQAWVRDLDPDERHHIHELILAALLDPEVDVAVEAVVAIGHTRERRFVPVLIVLALDHRTQKTTTSFEDEHGNIILEDQFDRAVAMEAKRILAEW